MRTKLTIFNQVDRNGRVKVANSKEEIENLFRQFEKTGSLITNGLDNESPNIEQRERDVRFNTINLMNVCGKIENIEIIETNKNGYGDLPLYEVYGDIVAFDTPSGNIFNECFDQNLVTIDIRALGQNRMVNNQIVTDITKVICWDTITR